MCNIFDYTVLPGGGAALVRAYGDSPVLALPEALPGPGGCTLPLVQLGGYCFAETVRDQPRGEVLRCVRGGDGALRPIPPESVPAEELHPAAGRFLEEVALPAALREIGNCAFYNCRALRRLTAGSGPLAVGSDVFLNCFDLAEVALYARPDAATGLPAIVNNISGNLRAVFQPAGPEGEVCAAFRYPEYWEDIEETPAHILLHTFSGQGYHYRQCFRGRAAAADGRIRRRICPGPRRGRPCLHGPALLRPAALSLAAGSKGRGAVPGSSSPSRAGAVAAALIQVQDRDGLQALLDLKALDGPALAAASRAAQRAGDAQAAALVADAEYQARAAAPKRRRRYDFDF